MTTPENQRAIRLQLYLQGYCIDCRKPRGDAPGKRCLSCAKRNAESAAKRREPTTGVRKISSGYLRAVTDADLADWERDPSRLPRKPPGAGR